MLIVPTDWTPSMLLLAIGLALLLAACLSVLLSPLVARGAIRLRVLDRPDGRRKCQARPVPLGGGVAVALSSALAWAVGALWLADVSGWQSDGTFAASFIPAALVIILVGLADDLYGLPGMYKLAGQVLAASVLVSRGFRFDSISLGGWELSLGDLGVPFSLFFCLGAINAFNLMDGSDALASSIGIVVCLTLGIVTAALGALSPALASFALAGALLGFLRWNAPPAKIYLGDTGSMLIGLAVAAIAIGCSVKQQTAVALAVPVAICAVPILDAAAAMVRRVITGQSVFATDRGHLHHALLLRGLSVGETAAAAAGLTAFTSAAALASFFTGVEFIAVAAVSIVFAALAVNRVFGHKELGLIASTANLLLKRVRVRWRHGDGQSHPTSQAVQLQGAKPWNDLWDALREAANVHQLHSMKLNLGIPQLHESFFGNWQANDSVASSWQLSLPITWQGMAIGRLTVAGTANGAAGREQLQLFLDYLDPLESHIAQLLSDSPARNVTLISAPVNADALHRLPKAAAVS